MHGNSKELLIEFVEPLRINKLPNLILYLLF